MPTLWQCEADGHAVRGEHCYRVADLTWFSAEPIAALEPFPGAAEPAAPPDSVTGFQDVGASAVTEGWLAGAQRSARADYGDGRCRVGVEGVGEFLVQPDRIDYPEPDAASSLAVLIEALLGPALLLALAAHGRFALHASAAQTADRRLWVFLGDSGAGKSTLAAAIGAHPGCRPVADDVLPIRWDGETLWALPAYPQLKLGDHAQYAGRDMPARLAISGLCVLAPRDPGDAVTIASVSPLEATTTLIRQTVSARLFSPGLLRRQLRELAEAAASVPVYRLHVPRDLGRLDEVYRTLIRTPSLRAPLGLGA